MMQSYSLFTRIDIRHDYFQDGAAQHLQIRANPDTQRFLDRFDMLMRCDGRSLALIACNQRLAAMWSERMDGGAPRMLRFALNSIDAYCASYTDMGMQGLPCAFAPTPDAPASLVPVQPPAPLTQASGGGTLLGEFAIPLVGNGVSALDDWSKTFGQAYALQLQARSTVWKYLLIGNAQDYTLQLIDPQSQVEFSDPSSEALPDGRSATVFRTKAAIPLRERPPQRFQLRDASRLPAKVLISRLPNAAPQRWARDQIDGRSVVVSEIFVNL
jgi:hypothetical protein